MAQNKGVSSKTHNQKQLDDYANQHNPNNKAYAARKKNAERNKKSFPKKEAIRRAKFESEYGLNVAMDWMCFSNPYDFD